MSIKKEIFKVQKKKADSKRTANYESGLKIGRFTLTGKCYIGHKYFKYVEGICDCGNIKWVHLTMLLNGHTQSCGCKQKESVSKHSTTHGLSKHPLYKTWSGMIQRCTNSNNERFADYGGRGILVYEKWIKFLPFYEWAINNGWGEGLEIDRQNNDGNYYPDNCWFTTTSVQNRNRRNNIIIEAFGEKKCAMDWQYHPKCTVLRQTIVNRINKGMDVEKAIITKAYNK